MQIWNKGGKGCYTSRNAVDRDTRRRGIYETVVYILKGFHVSGMIDDCISTVVASICRSKPAKRKVVEHLASYFTSCSKWHRKPVVAVCAVWKSALNSELRFYVSQDADAKRFMISRRRKNMDQIFESRKKNLNLLRFILDFGT